MNDNTTNIGKVKTVVVNRGKLLSIIKENKAKHDALFETAVSGYWIATKSIIDEKIKEFNKYTVALTKDFNKSTSNLLEKIENKERVDSYSSIQTNAYFNYSVNLKYPESHSNEYNKAIRSIELNIYDNIELSEQEFDQYVMNNWTWKNSFITTNSNYVDSGANCITGYYALGIQTSGCSIL